MNYGASQHHSTIKKNRADKTQKKVCEFRATLGPFLLMEPWSYV